MALNPNATILSFTLVGTPELMEKQLKNAEATVRDRVNKLVESCKGGRWSDPEFGPRASDAKGARAIYRGGKRSRDSMPDPSRIVWLRPNYLDRPKLKEKQVLCDGASLFKGGHCSGDVIQGQVGDCWLISALAMIANEQGLLDDIFFTGLTRKERGQSLNVLWVDAGIWVCRFCDNNTFKYVIIDDQFPCNMSSPEKLVFGRCEDISELWVPIAEKAYAKLMGSYDSLSGGFSQIALRDLTGLCPEAIDVNDKKSKTPFVGKRLYDYIYERLSWSCLMGASCENLSGAVGEGKGAQGLITGHAYSLLGLLPINTADGLVNLVVLRNPWGSGEWKGTWSDKCPKKKRYINLIKKAWREKPVKRRRNLYSARGRTTQVEDDLDMFDDVDNGVFCMDILDFQKYFSEVIACVDFPDEWRGRRVIGQWDKKNSGGNSSLATWRINPAFKLSIPKNNTRVVIRLDQEDKRAKYGVDFADKMYAIAFRVVPANFNFTRAGVAVPRVIPNSVENFDQTKYAYCESSTIDLRMNKGDVYIVASTYNVGELGLFSLSVYCNAQDFDLEGSEIIGQEEQVERRPHHGHFNIELGFDHFKYFETRKNFMKSLADNGIDREVIANDYNNNKDETPLTIDQFRNDLARYGVPPNLITDDVYRTLSGRDGKMSHSEYYALFHQKMIFDKMADEDGGESLRLKWDEIRHKRREERGGAEPNTYGKVADFLSGGSSGDRKSDVKKPDDSSSNTSTSTSSTTKVVDNRTIINNNNNNTNNNTNTNTNKSSTQQSTSSTSTSTKSSSSSSTTNNTQQKQQSSSTSTSTSSKTVVSSGDGHTCSTQTNVVIKSTERKVTPVPFPPPPYRRYY